MRYIANKLNKDYEITHINDMKDLKGNKVEVIIGKNIINKEKLEESIKNSKLEREERIKQMDIDIADLEAILKAIKTVK